VTASHNLQVVINGAQLGGWEGYHVDSSLVTLADAFVLRRPFDAQMWNLLRRDSDVSITIDGTTILRGFIDKRRKDSKAGQMTISGRDRSGRVVDESAPRIDYTGMTVLAAVKELVSPWFDRVTLSDERNRLLRRSKGKRIAGGAEPVIDIQIRVPRRGVVHPGMSRGQVIKEIAARASCIAYSSADGREFFIGRPNQQQPAQYEFVNAAPNLRRPGAEYVIDLVIEEDDGDRYSLIMCAGTGGQSDTNYGKNITNNTGVVFDNPLDKRDLTTRDGTGRDFIHPKRLFMPERDFESYGDAQRVARNEQVRRDMKRHIVTITAPLHGQFLDAGPATLFAPGCVAHVIDEDQDPRLDDNYLILSCAFTSERDQGETTTMHMVPTGTEILL
jgi:prophage tail gpP-like protein